MARIDLPDKYRDEGPPLQTSALHLQTLLRDALETAEAGRMLDGDQLERIRATLRARPSSLLDLRRAARFFGCAIVTEEFLEQNGDMVARYQKRIRELEELERALRSALRAERESKRGIMRRYLRDKLRKREEQLEALQIAARSTVDTWRGERRLMPMAMTNLDAVLGISNPASKPESDPASGADGRREVAIDFYTIADDLRIFRQHLGYPDGELMASEHALDRIRMRVGV